MQYKGMVEGSIRGAVQAGRPVTAIGIQGGPICDVEQREMVGLVKTEVQRIECERKFAALKKKSTEYWAQRDRVPSEDEAVDDEDVCGHVIVHEF